MRFIVALFADNFISGVEKEANKKKTADFYSRIVDATRPFDVICKTLLLTDFSISVS